MSLPTPDCPLESRTTSTEDPFISPEYHLRNRSLSSASHVSATSSTADFCSNASTFRRRRSVWHWPLSDLRLQSLRLRAIPLRWLAVFLCLVATLVVWRLPPPSTEKYTFHVDQLSSSSTPWVLRPHDSGKSSAIDPERWLRENSEEALAKKRRWWTRPPPKPRAAIISLVRNEELEGIMQSMRQLEYHWNGRYNYPWVFFNEKPFTEEFKVCSEYNHPWCSVSDIPHRPQRQTSPLLKPTTN